MAGRCRDAQLICFSGQTQHKTRRGAQRKAFLWQTEIAASSECLAKRVQGLGQMAPKPKGWFVRKKVFWANTHETAGLLERNIDQNSELNAGSRWQGNITISPANLMTRPQMVHVLSQTAPFPKPILHTYFIQAIGGRRSVVEDESLSRGR